MNKMVASDVFSETNDTPTNNQANANAMTSGDGNSSVGVASADSGTVTSVNSGTGNHASSHNHNHSHHHHNANHNQQQSSHHHHTHHSHHHLQPSSLSTTDDYSSRYSSFQDTESLKSAILDSFRMHWIQAWSIMEGKILKEITTDDLSSIINHLEQMISLLIDDNINDVRTNGSDLSAELNRHEQISSVTTDDNSCQIGHATTATTSIICSLLDFLSTESIFEKIYQWSEMSGDWKPAMYLEQLKLYELLISQYYHQTETNVLMKPSFIQPLIYLLDSLSTFLLSNFTNFGNYLEIEKRLVILLNTLCVAISHNNQLLNLFIHFPKHHGHSDDNSINKQFETSPQTNCDFINEDNIHEDDDDNDEDSLNGQFSFTIFSLLIQFVHREGPIGQQSRDAILLCLAISRHNERLAYYVANNTDFCPVLATGLSGHFSSLPRVLIGHSSSSTGSSSSSFIDSHRIRHELIGGDGAGSKEIEHFLKCLDFCNAVIQISHPIIQVQLLKFTFNGFLISVIGPALHQDVANVSVNDLETLPSYSNTLDVIITTTAYLDLFIRTISEPKLIRIFLEFLCFEVYDNNFILSTLINRIEAKSKLSLITLIFFKTLLDLNCEDLLYELIFKHLLRGRHLKKENESTIAENKKKYGQSYDSYQKNWLAISAQKLLSSSVSYYLSNLCPHHQSQHHHNNHNMCNDNESISSFDSNCKCNSKDYFQNYLDYLNDARQSIEQCFQATRFWRNCYYEPCDLLNKVHDQNIIFCTIEHRNISNYNNNNNIDNCDDDNINNKHNDDDDGHHNNQDDNQDDDEDILHINSIISHNSMLAKYSHGYKMNNCYYDDKLKKISFRIDSSLLMNNPYINNHVNHLHHQQDYPIGSFLTILFAKFEKFFENDVLTNLHLTGLLTRLCHFPQKLLLSLLFDETLSRTKNVPCFLHLLQKLSLEAQNYCDEMPDFETVFHAAKSNLQSMPIGELDCTLLSSNNSYLRSSNTSLSKNSSNNDSSESASQHKAFGLLKNLFFRSSSHHHTNQTSTLTRRPSNVSTVSSTGQLLEVVPGGMRFINQHVRQKEKETTLNMKFNELVYNLIVYDEFLMELSAILIEHSVRDFCK